MKKIMAAILAGAVLTGSSLAAPIELEIGSKSITTLNENALESTSALLDVTEINGRSYLDIDTLASLLGAEIKDIVKNAEYEIKSGDNSVIYKVNSNIVKVNGKEKEIDSEPLAVTPYGENETYIMLPVRFTAETLGFSVDYIRTMKKVLISDTQPIADVNSVKIGGDEYKLYYDVYYNNMIKAYGEENSDEISATLKADIKNMLVQNYIIYSNAIESGFDIVLDSAEAENNIKSTLNDFKTQNNDIVNLDSVAGAVFENDYVIQNYLKAIQMSVKTSDEEINEKYNNEYMCAKHILIMTSNSGEEFTEKANAEKKIKEISEKIKKGENFDTLMNENSQDTGLSSYPDGYVFTEGEMVPEFENAVKALKEGEISDIIESDYGYHVVKREKLPEIGTDIKEQIRYEINSKKYNEFIEGLLNSAEVEIYGE